MFGRGVWSIFGIRQASRLAFEATLVDSIKLFQFSQFVAAIRSKYEGGPTFGINPYLYPRKDENEITTITSEVATSFLEREISPDLVKTYTGLYGNDISGYDLGNGQYAFWFVANEFEDVTDPKSKQESLAYKDANKPFKFCNKEEKKLIEGQVTASAVSSRVQFQVLIDFSSELVFVASSSLEQVEKVRALIKAMGGDDFSLAWDFGDYDWPSKFLNNINKNMRDSYRAAMAERAEELSRFRPEEVEKLEDKMMENIVSSYFAISESETGNWTGLTTPARVKLFASGEPASVANPSVAFSLLQEFTQGSIAAASVVFQRLDSKFNKKGEETQYRTDIFTIDVNDNINLTEAGAAMLRGFDMPFFKKEMKRQAKSQENITIADYWRQWLSEMKTSINMFADNVTETLQIDKFKYGLKAYSVESESEAVGTSN